MKKIEQGFFSGERSLFKSNDLCIENTIFDDGESPLKESKNIELVGSMFKWKYPLWYGENISMSRCTLFETARAGIWYTDNIKADNCIIEAPKAFRRCRNIELIGTSFVNAEETLWHCRDISMRNVTARGDYFAMNSGDISISGFELIGNYSFDGCKNIEIHNARMLSKDAFWNSENVTVYDSFISGEYLCWNSKNVTFVNCTIESLQGMCYAEALKMENCRLINTTLAFEYSTVNADILGTIDSVKNPSGGVIRADEIKELILEPDKVDTGKTMIITKK